jgi:hypothetical protein
VWQASYVTEQTTGTSWEDLLINSDPQLILGRRQGTREIEAVVVDLHQGLFRELGDTCGRFLEELAATSPRAYEPNAAVDRDDQHFILELDEVPEQPAPSSRRRRAQDMDEQDNRDRTAALVRTLRAPGRLEQIDASRLRGFKAMFYAIAYQQPDGSWIHFIKKVDPRRILKPGLMWTHFGTSLRKIDAPDMVIESSIDVLLTQDRLAGFSGTVIRNLFTDVHLAVRDVPTYVANIVTSLGSEMIIDDASREVLCRAAGKKISFAMRLYALQHTLDNMEMKPDMVRDVLTAHGVDHAQLLDSDGRFSFEEKAVGIFIDVMEGRYFESDWSGELRRADRFSTRTRS